MKRKEIKLSDELLAEFKTIGKKERHRNLSQTIEFVLWKGVDKYND